MKFFMKQYKGIYALPNNVYSEVKQDFKSYFQLKTRHLFPSDVVIVEPQISSDANEAIRRAGGKGYIEQTLIMITTVEPFGDDKHGKPSGFIYGFVKLESLPKPFLNVVDNLFEENEHLREAVSGQGLNPHLAALGVKQ